VLLVWLNRHLLPEAVSRCLVGLSEMCISSCCRYHRSEKLEAHTSFRKREKARSEKLKVLHSLNCFAKKEGRGEERRGGNYRVFKSFLWGEFRALQVFSIQEKKRDNNQNVEAESCKLLAEKQIFSIECLVSLFKRKQIHF